jgi:hypothetical protein
MQHINERWRVIADFPNYEVSDYGKVRRTWKSHASPKATSLNRFGYEVVHLSNNGINKHRAIHRLVATAFVDNPNKLLEVNHIDGNKANNRADNLEWVSRSENMKHAYSIGNGRWK